MKFKAQMRKFFAISIFNFFSALLASRLSNFRFWIVSISGGIFLLIYEDTAIFNFALLDSVGFYALNGIPFIVSDIIIYLDKSQKSMFFVGGC
jgi:hypothetical protein